MKTAFRILVTQRNNRTHYKVTCGPCDYFMVRVRASVSIAITLVLGQPYLNIRLHLCVYLGGRCLGQDERGRTQRWMNRVAHLHTVSFLLWLYAPPSGLWEKDTVIGKTKNPKRS